MNLSRLLLRNAVFGGAARFVTLLVGLVLTPYLLARLGPERFGIWALATVVAGSLGLFDLSFKTGFVKHLAETLALKDHKGFSSVVTTGFVTYLGFAAAAWTAYLFLRTPILTFLAIPQPLRGEAGDVFAIAIATYLVGAVFSVLAAVCDAQQRMDLTHGLGVAALVATAAGTVVAVESGLGLRGVALSQLAGTMLFYVAATVAARRLAGPFGLSPKALDGAWLRRLLRFGSTLHISSSCGIVNRQLDKLLLSRWSGLGMVSSYEIGARLVTNAGSFQPYLAAALLPASSHLETLGRRERLVEIYRNASRFLFLAGIPPFVFLAVNSRNLILGWLGHEEPTVAAIVVLLAGGYLFNSLSNGMAFVCQGVGQPAIQARQSAIQLVANVVLSLGLLLAIGPFGAPVGTSLALIVGAGVFAHDLHTFLGVSTLGLLREAAAVPALLAIAAAGAGRLAGLWITAETRAQALFELALNATVFATVFLVGCALTRTLQKTDLEHLRSALRRTPKAAIR